MEIGVFVWALIVIIITALAVALVIEIGKAALPAIMTPLVQRLLWLIVAIVAVWQIIKILLMVAGQFGG